jgi:kynurenine formamidase
VYELAHVHSNTMPISLFGAPPKIEYNPTLGMHDTVQAFNSDSVTGSPGMQGTRIDALGLFGYTERVWDGKGTFDPSAVRYYGGYRQADVKPTPAAPLEKLGVDKIPPIVTSAVLLDARTYIGHGRAMRAAEQIHSKDIQGMVKAQGLAWRGLLPGDAVYIYTGWEDNWREPATDQRYFTGSPGLATDAVKYLGSRSIVLVALDNPFTDPMQIDREARNEGVPAEIFFSAHHFNLTQNGIYQVQNAHLAELAKDRVWLSCTMVLPSRDFGSAATPVRPVAIGTPASRQPQPASR